MPIGSINGGERVHPRKSFVFLQSPGTPFFARLADELTRRGHAVARVNFCGGDAVFWRRSGARRFNRPPAEYPRFLDELFRSTAATDLVLFGDCRPIHRIAIDAADRRSIRVHVFEEGYVRPDWITLEAGGTNGFSSLPRDPDYYLRAVRTLEEAAPHEPVGSGFRMRVAYAIAYHLGNLFLMPWFRHYRTHRPHRADRELVGWLRRLVALPGRIRRVRRTQEEILGGSRPFFLFPLQLDSDAQIRVHSSFGSMANAIRHVVSSFARSAPPDTILAIKNHPLDNGLVDYARLIRRIAAMHGVSDRVRFLDAGETAQLVRGCVGVVVVNSTVGMSALYHGRPTIALGNAIYDIPGLTFQDGLDAFWSRPEPPDKALHRAFRRVVLATTQINGNFYTARGVALAVAGAVARLEAHVSAHEAASERAFRKTVRDLRDDREAPVPAPERDLGWASD